MSAELIRCAAPKCETTFFLVPERDRPTFCFDHAETMPRHACAACGYAGTARAFSAEWHRGHLVAHCRRYPNLDFRSIANLVEFVELALAREESAA